MNFFSKIFLMQIRFFYRQFVILVFCWSFWGNLGFYFLVIFFSCFWVVVCSRRDSRQIFYLFFWRRSVGVQFFRLWIVLVVGCFMSDIFYSMIIFQRVICRIQFQFSLCFIYFLLLFCFFSREFFLFLLSLWVILVFLSWWVIQRSYFFYQRRRISICWFICNCWRIIQSYSFLCFIRYCRVSIFISRRIRCLWRCMVLVSFFVVVILCRSWFFYLFCFLSNGSWNYYLGRMDILEIFWLVVYLGRIVEKMGKGF